MPRPSVIDNSNPPPLQAGVNLIELLIVLVIAGLLLGVALPAGQGMIDRGHLRAATNEVYSALLFTRNEAVRLRQNFSLCAIASPSPSSCEGDKDGITANGRYLGVFDGESGFTLTSGRATNPLDLEQNRARVRLVNATDNRLVFQRLGNRDEGDDPSKPVYLEITVKDLKAQIEVCFNGRIQIRKNLGGNKCEG